MKNALLERLYTEKERLEAELATANGNGKKTTDKDYFPGFEAQHVYKLMDEYNHVIERISQAEGYEVEETDEEPAGKKTAAKKTTTKRR